MAFSILELAQGRIEEVTEVLSKIPEVLEAHTIAGRGDLLIRIVALTNDHLMEVSPPKGPRSARRQGGFVEPAMSPALLVNLTALEFRAGVEA